MNTTTTDLNKERRASIAFFLMILVVMAIPASIAYKLYLDVQEENAREYSLSCSQGFKSSFGERPWSYDRTTRWSTPDGSYLQKPGEVCKIYYRVKEAK